MAERPKRGPEELREDLENLKRLPENLERLTRKFKEIFGGGDTEETTDKENSDNDNDE